MNISATGLLTAAIAAMVAAAPAHAVSSVPGFPTGATVVAGSITTRTAANAINVYTHSAATIINYDSFSIAAGNIVRFLQPTRQSAVLARVTGTAATTIDGTLMSTGQVYLINPNGIAIDATGRLNIMGGFVGSTLAMADDEFLGARKTFTGNGASAAVTNAGFISSQYFAALLGGTVVNTGRIAVTLPLGKIALGSGEAATLDVSGDGFLQVTMPTTAGGTDALIQSSGALVATSGSITIAAATASDLVRNAINLSGTVSATSVSGHNGSITIDGGAGGQVAINTNIRVLGAGTVAINTAASPAGLAFGPLGGVTFRNADGTAEKAPVAGQSLTINGADTSLLAYKH